MNVVGVKHAAAEHAFVEQRPQLSGGLFIQHHSRVWFHQDDFKTRLALYLHGEPAIARTDLCISVDFKAQLIAIELERFLLVLHPDQHVRHFCNHDSRFLRSDFETEHKRFRGN